jgi:hypothetical protein
LSDCAIFPSVVAEAGPMVLLEAASAGSFPLGTDQAGMAHNLSRLFEGAPPEWLTTARLPPDPASAIFALARQIPEAIALSQIAAPALRANCVGQFDWNSLATHLLVSLAATRRTHAA